MHVSLTLIALALGYLVFLSASKEKEGIKILGQVIGIVVMLAALLAFACESAKCATKYGCHIMQKMPCPMMGQKDMPGGPK